jgi:hypothetical protein
MRRLGECAGGIVRSPEPASVVAWAVAILIVAICLAASVQIIKWAAQS